MPGNRLAASTQQRLLIRQESVSMHDAQAGSDTMHDAHAKGDSMHDAPCMMRQQGVIPCIIQPDQS